VTKPVKKRVIYLFFKYFFGGFFSFLFVQYSALLHLPPPAVSINNSLDPAPQALAVLHHGVPVEGPQHLLHLLDQILGFVARLFNDPYFRLAPHKIVKKVTIR
jgi:hypothetical protein